MMLRATTVANERRFEARDQREAGLRRHAQDVLRAYGLTSAPIDLLALTADRSELRVVAKDLRRSCDGLLRWVPASRRFYLYYDPNPFKARFNLAHELAHYFIDEHHHAIRTGHGVHKSNTQSLIGHRRMETEANLYAAELLVPRFLFRTLVDDSEPCVEDLQHVASVFNTSLQCAARKIVEHAAMPAAMVVSRGGIVQWGMWNTGMVSHGIWGFTAEMPIPVASATARAAGAGTSQTGSTHAGLWFEEARYRMPLREEAFPTPGHRSVITLLSQA
jgi:hypothetical protein